MVNSTTAAAPVRAPAKRQIKIDFSPEKLQAPFLLRIGAMAIDYMVLLVLPVGSLLFARFYGSALDIMTDQTLWFISVLLFLANIILLPLFTGRSLGKILTGLRVVRIDGSQPRALNIFLRQTLGYLLTLLTCGIGLLVAVFSKKGRALHDIVSKTIVVRGSKRTT